MSLIPADMIERTVQAVVQVLLGAGCPVDEDKVRRIRKVVSSQWESEDVRSEEDFKRYFLQNRYRAHWRWKERKKKRGER